jgi:hypothetical protein
MKGQAMTADERATLAEAHALVERIGQRVVSNANPCPSLDEWLRLDALLRGLLAEPQVNPSEAICPRCKWGMDTPGHRRKCRAGLLAEGEEADRG